MSAAWKVDFLNEQMIQLVAYKLVVKIFVLSLLWSTRSLIYSQADFN